MGLTEIIKYARDNEESYDIQKKIYDASQELDKILRDLVLTIEIKKEINEALVEISLDQLINKTISMFQDEIKSNIIDVVVSSEVKKIKTIAAYMESILHNLVSNAIKYRNTNRPSRIEILSTYMDELVEIRVKDNGLGIDLDRNKRDLFNFYKRFHFHVEGRGLGLFLVKSQVELLGGTIKVESEVDRGTTFIVRLRHNLESGESVLT
jgi:signal transduction histidine kinase